MKCLLSKLKFPVLYLSGVLAIQFLQTQSAVGQTEIMKWQDGKKGAVSITYDDGSINQFVKAVPIMNQLNFPGTFFIITGNIPGSKYPSKFIGRPMAEIINESKTIPTGKDNFFERASAARFLGYKITSEYFTNTGDAYDEGRYEEAYKIIDELYSKVNNGGFQRETESGKMVKKENVLTWDMIKTFVAQGHEFGSHMIDHPYLGTLDEFNMLYELEKSQEEIRNQIGPKYTFSAETPYCSQDKRVMDYANKVYPAIRSSLTDEFFQQIRFSESKSPVNKTIDYVQWQRGTYTKTPLSVYKAWIDTTAAQENIWLVLIIHGLDGIGWESVKSQDIDEYFRYIKTKENDLWIATYGDITRYIRERKNSELKSSESKRKITIKLTNSLDRSVYDIPLTLKTVVRQGWKEVKVRQGSDLSRLKTQHQGKVTFVLYKAFPNNGDIEITE